MGDRRSMFVPLALLVLIAPLAASSISVESSQQGGFDANGDWVPSIESDINWNWWAHWSRDKDSNSLDDRLEWLIEQPDKLRGIGGRGLQREVQGFSWTMITTQQMPISQP